MIIIERLSLLPGGGLAAEVQFNVGVEILQITLTISETEEMLRAERELYEAVQKEVDRLVRNAGVSEDTESREG